jgi:hypothetical protein
MRGVDIPPCVREDVEDGEHDDEECACPLGLEANSNEGACCQTEDGNKKTRDAPLSL